MNRRPHTSNINLSEDSLLGKLVGVRMNLLRHSVFVMLSP